MGEHVIIATNAWNITRTTAQLVKELRAGSGTEFSVTIPRQSRRLSGLRLPQRGLIAIQSQKPLQTTFALTPNAEPINARILPQTSNDYCLPGIAGGLSYFSSVFQNALAIFAVQQAFVVGRADLAFKLARAPILCSRLRAHHSRASGLSSRR